MANLNFFEKWLIPTYDNPAHISAGTVEIDAEKCSQCLVCIKLCPAEALVAIEKRPVMRPPGINECIACGACIAYCEEQAITLTASLSCNRRYKTLDHEELQLPRL